MQYGGPTLDDDNDDDDNGTTAAAAAASASLAAETNSGQGQQNVAPSMQPTLERRRWCATLVKRPKSQGQAFLAVIALVQHINALERLSAEPQI
jgi:hypothetical protein